MNKLLLSALAAGLILVPLTNAEAKENKQPQLPAVQSESQGLSATATARTNRDLLNESAGAKVYQGSVQAVQAQVPAHAYHMRSGDVVQLIVYGHEDISTKLGQTSYSPYVVRPDGNLSIPLIGDVQCSGRTVADVVNEITKRLSEYIIDPQVTINITTLGTTRVTVLGEVTQQGNYELQKSHTLVDAVGAARGFTNKAAKRQVYVVRRGMQDFVVKVNMLKLLKGGDATCNPELQEGDMVYISSNHKLTFIQAMGIVSNLASATDNVLEARNYIRNW